MNRITLDFVDDWGVSFGASGSGYAQPHQEGAELVCVCGLALIGEIEFREVDWSNVESSHMDEDPIAEIERELRRRRTWT